MSKLESLDVETFAADGAPLLEEEDGEEMIMDDGGSASKADAFTVALGELEVLMMDEGLTSRVDAFTSEHCGIFEAGDENKLEYTTLFAEYTSMVEAYIEQQLGASVASFDMQSFCATLSERVASDESLLDHPALEMLFAYSDFEAFKALMLSTREGSAIEAAGGMLCVSGDKLDVIASPSGGSQMLPGMDDDDGDGEEMDGLGVQGLSVSGMSPMKAGA